MEQMMTIYFHTRLLLKGRTSPYLQWDDLELPKLKSYSRTNISKSLQATLIHTKDNRATLWSRLFYNGTWDDYLGLLYTDFCTCFRRITDSPFVLSSCEKRCKNDAHFFRSLNNGLPFVLGTLPCFLIASNGLYKLAFADNYQWFNLRDAAAATSGKLVCIDLTFAIDILYKYHLSWQRTQKFSVT